MFQVCATCPHCENSVPVYRRTLIAVVCRLLIGGGIGALLWVFGLGLGDALDAGPWVAWAAATGGFAVGFAWSGRVSRWQAEPTCPHCKRMLPLEMVGE